MCKLIFLYDFRGYLEFCILGLIDDSSFYDDFKITLQDGDVIFGNKTDGDFYINCPELISILHGVENGS